ncbi:hypothetical protein GH714_029396 [Hevea brasiliensis]|uniref:Uncharacterized protein n=1 Tax=Hevea brasiliensis TaxID=3981 RepID=A0A6A6KL60_HEVBR|nr:hypothetical protein GH714_029396 [Hevea brasiliensis]
MHRMQEGMRHFKKESPNHFMLASVINACASLGKLVSGKVTNVTPMKRLPCGTRCYLLAERVGEKNEGKELRCAGVSMGIAFADVEQENKEEIVEKEMLMYQPREKKSK